VQQRNSGVEEVAQVAAYSDLLGRSHHGIPHCVLVMHLYIAPSAFHDCLLLVHLFTTAAAAIQGLSRLSMCACS